ncbi:MAG: hypothetical protein JST05_09410 [Acidobacteria bacterium]|nr:hypothetical protein [Acidobacteriota bacterium]
MRLSPLILLLAAPLRADGLADLRAALQKLPATQPVKAVADCQSWSSSGKAKAPRIIQGRAEARLEDGPAGLRLGWDKAELARIEAASKAKDAGPKQAMDQINGEKAKDLLDAAGALLDDLKDAQLLGDQPEAWNGAPARLLTFKLDAKDLDEDDRKHLKSFSHILKVWVDGAAMPLASLEQMDMKGSVFLISFEGHTVERRKYARIGDHLVTAHSESEAHGSGAGQEGAQKTVIDLRI